MCSSVILLLLLLTQPGSSDGSCSKLKKRYYNGTDLIKVHVNEQAVETVVRGSGGAARAAAALLLVGIRHVLGYQARLNTTSVHLCDLIAISDKKEAAVVAPAVTWPQEGCKIQGSVDLFTKVSRPAAVSYELQLWAYVPSENCSSKVIVWSFFRNYNEVQKCGFQQSTSINENSNGYSNNYYAVLARNETSHDNEVATELQRRFEDSNLQLKIEYFKNDFLMRKKISELNDTGKAFLFIDENLWFDTRHVINVQPPPCAYSSKKCTSILNPISALRIGNGWFMDEFAPPISKLVNYFSPKMSQLREILDIEARQNISYIEEAACSWAYQHDEEFQNILSYNAQEDRRAFKIRIILCKGDPLNNMFVRVIKLINEEILYKTVKYINFNIYKKLIDCFDKDKLRQAVIDYIQDSNIAGVIAWSWSEGVVSAAKAAEKGYLPLLLAGPVTPEVMLGPSVLGTTGRLTDLIRALHYLLDSCGWSRIAILSDSSEYSKSFVETLLKQKKLLHRVEIVNYKTINLHLNKFKNIDARIFLLNGNWNISCQILCAALKLDMTPANGFMWIARDWRPLECCNDTGWKEMYHYTINFGWQGEHVENSWKDQENKLRNLLNINETANNFISNADSSTLADALLQLSYGFSRFYQKTPSHRYNLRSFISVSIFSEILENGIIKGVAQELKNKDFALENPLVFINKWQGVSSQPVGVFRMTPNRILVERPIVATCETLFGNQIVPDRPNCCTITTGDPFSFRCQDFTVAMVTVLLIFLVTLLYIARRNRLKLLLERELNIMASLLEIRKHTASSLDKYLVNRNAIKLLHEIGSGTFGRVYFAELQRPGQGAVVVAAKKPQNDIGPTEECEFFQEACVLAPLCHENIIGLVGICLMDGPPTVLMEHAFYLDLKRYLTERRHLVSSQSIDMSCDQAFEVSDESLTRLAREAAGALTYLTTKRLVHRDVRAANCLIDKKRSLKLGDFGMARELDVKTPEYSTIRRALFPVLWMAPESLQLGVFSFATDIWSLGVLIMEVVTLGARPYGDWQPTRVLNYVTAGGSPPLPPDISKQTSSLLHSCWERQPELRPSASWVHRYLMQNPLALSPALLKPYPPEPPIINIE